MHGEMFKKKFKWNQNTGRRTTLNTYATEDNVLRLGDLLLWYGEYKQVLFNYTLVIH